MNEVNKNKFIMITCISMSCNYCFVIFVNLSSHPNFVFTSIQLIQIFTIWHNFNSLDFGFFQSSLFCARHSIFPQTYTFRIYTCTTLYVYIENSKVRVASCSIMKFRTVSTGIYNLIALKFILSIVYGLYINTINIDIL